MKDLFRGAVAGTIYWASLTTPSKHGKYQYDLGNLSPKGVETLRNAGADVKFDEKGDKGFYITSKSTYPIPVVDADNNDLSGVVVGNGSKGVAMLAVRPYTNSFGKQIAFNTIKLVVQELIVYDKSADIDATSVLKQAV